MSHSTEVEDCDFMWGKKRGVGGKKKEVQFYESFTYDGEEYSLFDSVYLYKEGEPEPYIGKIVKIWEQPEQKKKVKVLWFFRPVEILNFLGDKSTLVNELFLACGEGVGLANVNPLEAVAGKCNITCTSSDGRNPQPSEEELKTADYVFFRTFDVGTCTISDRIDDKIAGVEVRYLFNRKGVITSNHIPKLDTAGKEENGNVVGSTEVLQLSSDATPGENLVSELITDKKKTLSVSAELERGSLDEKTLRRPGAGSSKDEGKPSKKARLDYSIKRSEEAYTSPSLAASKEKNENIVRKKLRVDSNEEVVKASGEACTSPSLAVSKEKNENIVRKKLRVDSNEEGVKASGTVGSASEDKIKPKLDKDSLRLDADSLKKVKPDEKRSKLSNGVVSDDTPAPDRNLKTDGGIVEVTKKPEADKSKWFKGLPWEERMQRAYEQGTLVLLENLDPAYTSGEIEDIIWHTFREHCTAKMVPSTTISSPHSGQAFVIFKSKDAANMAVRKLEEGCLMLPNRRPLVATWGCAPPSSAAGKASSFVGHLFIDKVQFKMQREEMRKAVSTSHCSQPNTVEYDMAMEWCLLRNRLDRSWAEMYKQQGDQLRKLKAAFKAK